MRIHNVHERTLPMGAADAGRLLGSLASRDDRLWPGERWPPMREVRDACAAIHLGNVPILIRDASYAGRAT
jgi:hypothetical protein